MLLASKAVTDSHLKKDEIPKIFPNTIVLLVKGKRIKELKLPIDSRVERFLHFRNCMETKCTLAAAVPVD